MKIFLLTTLVIICSVVYASDYKSKYIENGFITDNFSVPKGLDRMVDFWIEIYSKYDTDQLVIHDTEYFIVYDVIDISEIQKIDYFSEAVKEEIINSRVISVQKRNRDTLKIMQNSGVNINNAHSMELAEKFKDIQEQNKYLNATRPGRMRVQKGLSSNFKEAVDKSTQYIPLIQKQLQESGLPLELSRLPFVESFFDPFALSKSEAAGMWQIMKSTGQEQLKITKHYDERKCPELSTKVAVKVLKKNYEYLNNNWGLALTAYNYGMSGVRKAVETVGSSDIVEIIKKYNGDRFGFASKNFFAEFLAALYVESRHKKLFKELNYDKYLSYGTVLILKDIGITQLELILDVDRKEIEQNNPTLSRHVFLGQVPVPEGARIRVPLSRFNRLLSRTEVVKGINNYVKLI